MGENEAFAFSLTVSFFSVIAEKPEKAGDKVLNKRLPSENSTISTITLHT